MECNWKLFEINDIYNYQLVFIGQPKTNIGERNQSFQNNQSEETGWYEWAVNSKQIWQEIKGKQIIYVLSHSG